jgi:DNA-binding response OmpR family regulator
MVTAVDPDFDVIEMGFDGYVVNPISREELGATVQGLLDRREYEQAVLEYFSLVTKGAALQAEKPPDVLAENDRYQQLRSDIQELDSRLDDRIEDLTIEDYQRVAPSNGHPLTIGRGRSFAA